MPIVINRPGTYYTLKESAERLGFSRMHVWRLIEADELPAIGDKAARFVLIHERDLDQFPGRKRREKKSKKST